jgi:hypothetical protein
VTLQKHSLAYNSEDTFFSKLIVPRDPNFLSNPFFLINWNSWNGNLLRWWYPGKSEIVATDYHEVKHRQCQPHASVGAEQAIIPPRQEDGDNIKQWFVSV